MAQLNFRPHIGEKERAAALQALFSDQLVHGPIVEQFERRFAEWVHAEYAVATSSCTAALFLCALSGVRWKVPAMTHVATANALELAGVETKFTDEAIWDLETHIDRALHIEAQPDPVACYSFYPTKNMTSVEGGMVATNDKDLADEIRARRSFGYVRDPERPWLYDVEICGFNLRMSEVHAAVGLEQLKKLPEFQKRRRENARYLMRYIPRYAEIIGDAYCVNVYVDNRDDVIRKIRAAGIGASVHYPKPVPLMTYYAKKYGYAPGVFPDAEYIAETAISLPVGPYLGVDAMATIVETVKRAIQL